MFTTRTWQILKVSLRNFVRFRFQAAISVVASVIGTGGVLVCIGFVASGRLKIIDQISRLGTNVLIVTPLQSRSIGGRARTGNIVTTLQDADYRMILRSAGPFVASSPTVSSTLRIRAGDLTKNTTVIGCERDYFRIRRWDAASGQLFSASDNLRQNRVALLGSSAARDLFGDEDPIGLQITINRVPFIVLGVMTERGQGLDAANEDAQVYVPLETAMHRLAQVNYFGSIVFEVDRWERLDSAANAIELTLGQRHRRLLQSGPDFQIQNQKTLLETQLFSFQRLTFLLRVVAFSTFLVTSLGIFGVIWISIGNRIREIGTCRAIGATAADIAVQYFVQGMVGPLLGSCVGVTFASGILRVIELRANQPLVDSIQASIELSLGSTAIYSLTILVSCFRAFRIHPSAALRSE